MASRNIVLPFPVGREGLSAARDPQRLRSTHLQSTQNITFESGTIRKEGGASKYNSSAISGTPEIMGGWDWWPDTSTQRMIVFTDAGALLKDTGSGTFAVTLASGLTTTNVVPVFVEGGKEAAANNRKLFIFTGKNAVQVLSADGATTAAITNPPADWASTNQPTFGLIHEGRLWGGGNANDPHRLYYSLTTDHEDLTGAGSGSISVFPGEGEYLTGAISFRGLIIAFKYPVGIYIVDTTDPTVANWKVTRLSGSIGLAGPRALVAVDNDVLFAEPSGKINIVSAVQEFGNLGTQSLSSSLDMDEYIRENISTSRYGEIKMIYYTAKRRVEIAMSSASSTTNDTRLIVDYNIPQRPRFLESPRDTVVDLWLRKDSDGIHRPIAGDDAGFVWELDQDDRNKDGAAYAGELRTINTDFSEIDPKLANVRKNGQFLEIVFVPKGNWTLSVDVFWDDVYTQTINFTMGTSGTALGSLVLGTGRLSSTAATSRKRRLIGSGIRLGLAIRNNGLNEDFSLSTVYVHAAIGDETMSNVR